MKHVLRWSLRDGLPTLGLWIGGVCVVYIMIVYLFPSLSDLVETYMDESALILAMMGKEAEFLENQNLFDMWLTMEIFSWMGVIISAYVVIYAAGTFSGEVESGTMETLLAQPVRRRDVLIGKFSALCVNIAILMAAAYAAIVIAHAIWVDEPASRGLFADIFLNNYLLFWCVAGFSFLISAGADEQKKVIGICMGAVLLTFMINMVISIAHRMLILAKLTPFYYCDASKVLHRGAIDPVDAVVLFTAGAVFLAASIFRFESRDIA